MKRIEVIFYLLCAMTISLSAADLTPAQDKAQLAVFNYLDKENFQPKVANSDNSVYFRKNGVLYWITFKENSPLLYSFHRKAFKVGKESGDYMRKASMAAANEVNRQYKGVKVYVGENEGSIVAEIYAAKPEDFIAVLPKYLSLNYMTKI